MLFRHANADIFPHRGPDYANFFGVLCYISLVCVVLTVRPGNKVGLCSGICCATVDVFRANAFWPLSLRMCDVLIYLSCRVEEWGVGLVFTAIESHRHIYLDIVQRPWVFDA